MEEGLAGTGESGNERLDRATMVAVGGVDDGIGSLSFRVQQHRIIKRSDDRLDAMSGNRVGVGLAANQTANAMAVGDDGRRDCAADKSIRAGEEDSQLRCPCWPTRIIQRLRDETP
jgi:hypothetical protein